jgi:hypothetical protein
LKKRKKNKERRNDDEGDNDEDDEDVKDSREIQQARLCFFFTPKPSPAAFTLFALRSMWARSKR